MKWYLITTASLIGVTVFPIIEPLRQMVFANFEAINRALEFAQHLPH
jgi:hypothetical protein